MYIFNLIISISFACSCSVIAYNPVVNKNNAFQLNKSIINKGILAFSLGLLLNTGFVHASNIQPIYGKEEIMSQKSHGTSEKSVQEKLRWDVDVKLADRISNYNRNWAEFAGYFQSTSFFKQEEDGRNKPITFYDSVTGKPLFIAPQGRTFDEFKRESTSHGWPSFRDNEVVWDNVRVLPGGETVSISGTHLGHNLPDRQGNRYCINLVSIAGYPAFDGKL